MRRYLHIAVLATCGVAMAGCAANVAHYGDADKPPLTIYQRPAQLHGQSHYVLCRINLGCPGPTPLTPVQPALPLSFTEPKRPRPSIAAIPRAVRTDKPLLTIPFPYADAGLSRAQVSRIQAVIGLLPKNRPIQVTGYTDNQVVDGPVVGNTNLAQQRAQNVRSALIAGGVTPERIRVAARPLCCYVDSNDTPAGRQANRRVEITVR